MQKFRITHGVASEQVVEGEAAMLAAVAMMVAAGLSNILISKAESVVTAEQDSSFASEETLTMIRFNVEVARPR